MQAGINAEVAILVFHTVLAETLAADLAACPATATGVAFTTAACALQAACTHAIALRKEDVDECLDLDPVSARLGAVRTSLEASAARSQQQQVQSASIAQLDLATELARLRPLQVELPPPLQACASTVSVEQLVTANLDPIAELAFDAQTIQRRLEDVQRHPNCLQRSSAFLAAVEQRFFCTDLEQPQDAAQYHNTLVAYRYVLHAHQAALDINADKIAPCLMVELRSTEMLCVWIVLCITHRQAVTEWPALADYRLPVVSQDLRHLSLKHRLAAAAAERVRVYVDRWSAQDGTRIYTTDDGGCATWEMADKYAESHEWFQAALRDERAVQEARIDAHWAEVVRKQAEVCVGAGIYGLQGCRQWPNRGIQDLLADCKLAGVACTRYGPPCSAAPGSR